MPFALLQPTRPDEAIRLLSEGSGGSSVALAGGTDLLLDLEGGRMRPARVVSLRRLPWATYRFDRGRLTIGSTCPLARLEDEGRVAAGFPALHQAIRAVGGRALREQATLGGNLGRASPASDLVPVLLALDASVVVVGPSGRRSLTVPELLRGPRETTLVRGELIEAVRLDGPRPSAYLWQRVQPSHGISQVGVAVARDPVRRRWSVAVGGVLPRPTRIAQAEEALGAEPTEVGIELAAQTARRLAAFVTDQRASEAYRRRLVGVLVRRAIGQVLRAESRRAAPLRRTSSAVRARRAPATVRGRPRAARRTGGGRA